MQHIKKLKRHKKSMVFRLKGDKKVGRGELEKTKKVAQACTVSL